MQALQSKAASFSFQKAVDNNGKSFGITVSTPNGDVELTEDSYIVYSVSGEVIDICDKETFDSRYQVL